VIMDDTTRKLFSRKLYDTTDAIVWAHEFVTLFSEIDEGLMIGWFANAIETGRSAGRAEAQIDRYRRSDAEVDDQLNKADAEVDDYAQGVWAALAWMIGKEDSPPMGDGQADD
jgi:hypothetical protein